MLESKFVNMSNVGGTRVASERGMKAARISQAAGEPTRMKATWDYTKQLKSGNLIAIRVLAALSGCDVEEGGRTP